MKDKYLLYSKFLFTACLPTAVLVALAFMPAKRPAYRQTTETYKIDTLADNLRVPWQIIFLPDQTMLFTEREGRVRVYRNGKLLPKPAFNVADVVLKNKTGVLGLAIHPDFAKNKFVYLASNYQSGNRMKLRIRRFEFKNDTLINPMVILKDIPANQNHTGCRLVFSPDRKLYITTGDADEPMLAQDLKAYNGKILRFNDNGSIPSDNPFFENDTALKEIWSYGHRNPQGLAFQKGTNVLFESEHGPTGGDELNIIKKGTNYGWPVIHHDEKREGMEPPLTQYTPSIGPGETLFYEGDKLPQLKGKLLVACLRGESILSVTLDKNNKITDQQVLLKNKYGRIRSLVTGPDGYIYFSTSMNDPGEGHPRDEHDDMILRLKASGTGKMTTQQLAKSEFATGKRTPALMFRELCASCHGDKLKGTTVTKSLIGGKFAHGADRKSIIRNITNGIIDKGMPAWNGAISTKDIEGLADYILTIAK